MEKKGKESMFMRIESKKRRERRYLDSRMKLSFGFLEVKERKKERYRKRIERLVMMMSKA